MEIEVKYVENGLIETEVISKPKYDVEQVEINLFNQNITITTKDSRFTIEHVRFIKVS